MIAQPAAAEGAADTQAVTALVARVEELIARTEQERAFGCKRATTHRRGATLANGERADELTGQVKTRTSCFVATPGTGVGVGWCRNWCSGAIATTRANGHRSERVCGPGTLCGCHAHGEQQSGKRERESAKLQVHYENPFQEWVNDVQVAKRLHRHRRRRHAVFAESQHECEMGASSRCGSNTPNEQT